MLSFIRYKFVKSIACYLCISFALINFNIKTAAQQQDTINVINLSIEEILNLNVISSNKRPETLTETPAWMTVITAEEIALLNFNSLEEVLDYVVGCQSIRGEGNMFTTTTFRGNTLTHFNVNSLLLFDGIPLYNMYNGSFELSIIPLSSIKQIEILKGSNSVLYGTGAMNAVINIITWTDDSQGFNSKAKIKYGSFNNLNGQGGIYKNSNATKFGLFTEMNSGKGEPIQYISMIDSSKLILNNQLKRISLNGYVEKKGLKFSTQISNRALHHLDNNQFDTVIYVDYPDIYEIIYPNQADEYQIFTTLSYNKKTKNTISINARATYQEFNLFKKVNRKEQHYHSNGIFNEAEISFEPKKESFVLAGIHYNLYHGYRQIKVMQNSLTNSYFDVSENKIPTHDLALYLNGNIKHKNLNLFYGARFYLSTYDNNYSNHFAPRFAAVYSLKENMSIKAIYGNSFRVPGYYEKSSQTVTAYGNKSLKPEVSNSFDFVYQYHPKKVQFDANLFYVRIDDKIVREIPNPEVLEKLNNPNIELWYNNSKSARFYGIEINIKAKLNNKWYGFGGYSYTQANNIDDNPDILGDDVWYFAHLLNYGIQYNPMETINLTLSGKHISEWGPAPPSNVINFGVNIQPDKNMPFKLEFKVDNIFEETVYMPEIANRRIEIVPYTIKTENRLLYFGMSYNF